jgi:hypothetical protein
VERDRSPSRAKRILLGGPGGIAETVYGTVVVMATVTAASSDAHPWNLAVIVTVTVVVLWIAHVYAEALSASIESGLGLNRAGLAAIAGHEVAIPLAAVGPVAALVLGAAGVLREDSAIWLALAIGTVVLAVEGARYARVRRLGPVGTLTAVAVNLAVGLLVVGLKPSSSIDELLDSAVGREAA